MTDIEYLIHALRCSSTPGNMGREGKDCRNCRYGVLDLIPEGFPMKPDVEINGRGYTLNCDCDTIAEDAIRALQGEQHLYDEGENAVNERSKV